MKKIITFLTFSILASSVLNADVVRMEMGAGAWASSAEGQLSYTDPATSITASDVSTENETTNPYVWLIIKHPIPVLPNIRLEYSEVNTKGLASGSFKNFDASTTAVTQLDLTQFDITPYYNLLDNTAWITLDVGLNIKVLDADYKADSVTVDSVTADYSDSETLGLPMLYVRTRIEIPSTDVGIEADVKYLKYDSSTVYDARIKIDYTFSSFKVLQPAVEVGYRVQKYDLKDDDLDAKAHLEFSGVYAGVMIRF